MEDVRAAWTEVGDRLTALGLKLKMHAAEELSASADVDGEWARVRKAIDGVVDAFSDAARDPAVKEDVKLAVSALSDALDATAIAVRDRVRAACSALTDALTTEHREYETKIAELQRLADDCGEERPGALIEDLDRTLHFLEHQLLPHASAEDAVLYPAVGRLLGSEAATDTMRRDHEEIRHLVAVLHRHRQEVESGVLPAAWREIRGVLYGLHAILALHVAKEEELYLPLVDRELSDDDARELLEQMHQVVRGPRLAS